MSLRLLTVLCGMLTLLAEQPLPGGCLQRLPVDGTWAQYQVDIQLADTGINATWVVRSVGQEMFNGQPCRWIELQQVSESPEFGNLTWRCLVPESEFGEGKHPLGKAVKVWQKREGRDAQSVDSIESKDPMFGAFIQGPEQDLVTEETLEVVKWQGGDLECTVIHGDSKISLNGVAAKSHYRIFRHPDAPFGLGGVHWDLIMGAGQAKPAVTVKLTLQNQGTDAKAQYPDLGI